MTREQMVKQNWKPYMEIYYKNNRMEEGIYCLLISINFDDEVLELQPIGENYYEQSFFSAIQNCHTLKRMKVISKNGGIVKDKIEKSVAKQIKNFRNTINNL